MSTEEQRSTENRTHDGSVTDPLPPVLDGGIELREGYAEVAKGLEASASSAHPLRPLW